MIKRYRVSFTVLVDERLRQAQDEDLDPVGQRVTDWYDSDLIKAIGDEVAQVEHEPMDVADLGVIG